MRRQVLSALCALALAAGACSSNNGDTPDDGAATTTRPVATASFSLPPGTPGLVDEAWWNGRVDDYLLWATETAELNPTSITSVMAFAERAERDPEFSWDAEQVTVESFESSFAKMREYLDTADFGANMLLALYLDYADQLTPELVAEIETRLLAFKYWQTEPTPDEIPVDHQYYWTENHQIIFLATEYVAGQTWPDETFTNSGMTGREHMASAEPLIRHWITAKARFGYSEWLSHVYYVEDLMGLMLLADFADDAELADLAGMQLDVIFLEMGTHLQEGSFASTHGRTYKKDKNTSLHEDNWNMSKLIWDDTEYDWRGADKAMLLARAERYRIPEVVRQVGTADEVMIDTSRMGIDIDPVEAWTADPVAPHGLDYDDPLDKLIWFGAGALPSWQVLPVTKPHMIDHDLWESDLYQAFQVFREVIETTDMAELQQLARTLAPQIGSVILSQVNTYTWRSPEVMLSTAQNYRPGMRAEQVHVWQATLDANALVFTTHPSNETPESLDWSDDNGYWTGSASMPWSVQHENVGISVYSPLDSVSGYLDFTHAYFPQDHFDEVVRVDNWTIGRLGDGYVALWSMRDPTWRSYDPAVVATNDMVEDFDLVAEGGPDNVWIVEVGRAADWADAADPFGAFVEAVSAAEITTSAWEREAEFPDHTSGHDVSFVSPTQGPLSWTTSSGGDLTVGDEDVPIVDYPRWGNPWASSDFDSQVYEVSYGGFGLALDFTTATRSVTAP